MTRHFVTDVPSTTTTSAADGKKTFGTVADILAAAEDPNDKNMLTAAEHVASARALEAANQPAAAIQSWHRAALAHSKLGEHADVLACIRHAEHLAGNRDFAASLERKPAAADGTGDPDGEVFGDENEDQGQAATVGAQDPGGEVLGDEPSDTNGDAGAEETL